MRDAEDRDEVLVRPDYDALRKRLRVILAKLRAWGADVERLKAEIAKLKADAEAGEEWKNQ